ncbi:preprotein translocase subunit SecG [Marinobacter orientalis]|uniref:Protein-export membrane protein SecG n=1 Tax=Marinobacter orientalis TaxID=1928859 RepID=A0A7Y0RAM9_9GAMM|nr:preprotein translocase subunit SecG [Marinobacter orientalis]NMT62252.1 preprotein translocase subunit SecG [Marinobacter orientalis]TGX50967.1 preprotein translocase subunit SecG [Marinobacter orientalis]
MDWVETLVVVLHVVIAVALVGLVLIQHGKGANAGAAFGGGASQTVFGSEGSSSFLVRATTLLAIVFFVTSFSLAVFAKQRAEVAGEAGIPVVEESRSAAGQAGSESADEGEAGRGDENELPELE